MGVSSGCGEQEAGVASGRGWNLWVWLKGGIYIDFLILLIPTPLVYICSFLQQHCYFLFIFFVIIYLSSTIAEMRDGEASTRDCGTRAFLCDNHAEYVMVGRYASPVVVTAVSTVHNGCQSIEG